MLPGLTVMDCEARECGTALSETSFRRKHVKRKNQNYIVGKGEAP